MKVVIAPQAFKETLSAQGVAEAVREGIMRFDPSIESILFPLADGGDGSLDVLHRAGKIELCHALVTDATGRRKKVAWGMLHDNKTAVIEIALVCGLAILAKNERNPLTTSTYGVGELIRECLDRGFRQFIIGLGGSATCDAGVGMMQALGVSFRDGEGKELLRGGGSLKNLAQIDLGKIDPRLLEAHFLIACDVSNVLLGSRGSLVYAPQKGATPEIMIELDAGLKLFAEVTEKQLGRSCADQKGAGASGGLGAAFAIFLNSTLRLGADLMMDCLGFDHILEGINLVITGEGKIDHQTNYDKGPLVIAKKAKEKNIPVIAIVGALGDGVKNLYVEGITAILPLSFVPQGPHLPNPSEAISLASEQLLRIFSAARRQ